MGFVETKFRVQHNGYTSPKLEARKLIGKGGRGVFAKEHIRTNELLAVFGGQIVHWDELRQYSEEAISYSIQFEEELYLLSLEANEPSDFINHSCNPNAGLNGQVVLRAMREVDHKMRLLVVSGRDDRRRGGAHPRRIHVRLCKIVCFCDRLQFSR